MYSFHSPQLFGCSNYTGPSDLTLKTKNNKKDYVLPFCFIPSIDAAAGVSDDWAKAVAGIKYSYAVELADLGEYGFFMPAELIQPSFDEFWPALPEMSKAVQEFLDGLIH